MKKALVGLGVVGAAVAAGRKQSEQDLGAWEVPNWKRVRMLARTIGAGAEKLGEAAQEEDYKETYKFLSLLCHNMAFLASHLGDTPMQRKLRNVAEELLDTSEDY